MNNKKMSFRDLCKKTDKYFYFICDENLNLGEKLRSWRELNSISTNEIAEGIYAWRIYLGLEKVQVTITDDDINNTTTSPYLPIDHYVTSKQEELKNRRITSIRKNYIRWENLKEDYLSTSLSMSNLYILKQIMQCDYEFLFGEANTPHKMTRTLSLQTGLNTSSIEKLLSYDKNFLYSKDSTISAGYASAICNALNILINDHDLLIYLSYYLTCSHLDIEDDEIYVYEDGMSHAQKIR